MYTLQPDLTILYKITTFIYIWLIILALITSHIPKLHFCFLQAGGSRHLCRQSNEHVAHTMASILYYGSNSHVVMHLSVYGKNIPLCQVYIYNKCIQ